jgi:hypothetical protein
VLQWLDPVGRARYLISAAELGSGGLELVSPAGELVAALPCRGDLAVQVEYRGLQCLDGLRVDAVELVGHFGVSGELGSVGGKVAVELLVGDSTTELGFGFGGVVR